MGQTPGTLETQNDSALFMSVQAKRYASQNACIYIWRDSAQPGLQSIARVAPFWPARRPVLPVISEIVDHVLDYAIGDGLG